MYKDTSMAGSRPWASQILKPLLPLRLLGAQGWSYSYSPTRRLDRRDIHVLKLTEGCELLRRLDHAAMGGRERKEMRGGDRHRLVWEGRGR